MAGNHEAVDVAIVGGGLVGSATAAAIASSPLSRGLSIALIDPKPPALDSLPPMSLRTSTITPASKEFLQDISVWPLLPPHRVAAFREMVVWDAPGSLPTPSVAASAGALRFNAAMNNASELGFVVDNDSLRYALYLRLQHLQERERLPLQILPRAIRDIDYGDDDEEEAPVPAAAASGVGRAGASASASAKWPVIRLSDGQSLAARLVVACDGARSRVRALAGLDWFQGAYGERAVVATVAVAEPVTAAYQRFLATGPVAVLPLGAGCDGGGEDGGGAVPLANVVWTTTPAEARALDAAADADFVDELNAALAAHEDAPPGDASPPRAAGAAAADRMWGLMRRTLGAHGAHDEPELALPHALSVRGGRGSFPLHCGHAPSYVHARRRTVLAGDAAHSVHPLAGQGVNLGFGDARSLADAVAAAAGGGRDVGGEDGAPLMQYQAERLPANVAMLGLLHTLQRVFSVHSPPALRDLRRVGMSFLNASGPAKRAILRVMR